MLFKNRLPVFELITLASVIGLLSSCVATQTFPSVVRAGDTITLAIGSLDGLNRSNISVEYHPDSDPGNPIDLSQNVRSVIKIFPDKTSAAYWDVSSGNGLETATFLSGLSGHGPWQSVVAIDLPVTLPPGTGVFRVTPGPGVSYPLTLAQVQDVDIAIEVLESVNGSPALGKPHAFKHRKLAFNDDTKIGDIRQLEAVRQVVVNTTPDTSSGVGISGAAYTVSIAVLDNFQNDITHQISDSNFAVVLDDQPSYAREQTSLIWSRKDGVFKIIITSATGLQDYKLLRFSIFFSNQILARFNDWSIADNPSIMEHTFYDANGNVVYGLRSPSISIIN